MKSYKLHINKVDGIVVELLNAPNYRTRWVAFGSFQEFIKWVNETDVTIEQFAR